MVSSSTQGGSPTTVGGCDLSDLSTPAPSQVSSSSNPQPQQTSADSWGEFASAR